MVESEETYEYAKCNLMTSLPIIRNSQVDQVWNGVKLPTTCLID